MYENSRAKVEELLRDEERPDVGDSVASPNESNAGAAQSCRVRLGPDCHDGLAGRRREDSHSGERLAAPYSRICEGEGEREKLSLVQGQTGSPTLSALKAPHIEDQRLP
jgi:hypothetical protein